MRLRRFVRKLKLTLAGLAGLGGFAVACSAPNPGEMPPLAPRPEPMQPLPSQPERKAPVPGAPDPLEPKTPSPDAGVMQMPSPQVQGTHEPMQQGAPKPQAPTDAGVHDAVALPEEIPDALPGDAARRPESTGSTQSSGFNCC